MRVAASQLATCTWLLMKRRSLRTSASFTTASTESNAKAPPRNKDTHSAVALALALESPRTAELRGCLISWKM